MKALLIALCVAIEAFGVGPDFRKLCPADLALLIERADRALAENPHGEIALTPDLGLIQIPGSASVAYVEPGSLPWFERVSAKFGLQKLPDGKWPASNLDEKKTQIFTIGGEGGRPQRVLKVFSKRSREHFDAETKLSAQAAVGNPRVLVGDADLELRTISYPYFTENLSQRLARRKPYQVGNRESAKASVAVLDFLSALGETIAKVNANGVIHGDLKPANIFLDEKEMPVLADFDISRAISVAKVTPPSTIRGTLAYMSEKGHFESPKHLGSNRACLDCIDAEPLGFIAWELFGGPSFGSQTAERGMREYAMDSIDRGKSLKTLRPVTSLYGLAKAENKYVSEHDAVLSALANFRYETPEQFLAIVRKAKAAIQRQNPKHFFSSPEVESRIRDLAESRPEIYLASPELESLPIWKEYRFQAEQNQRARAPRFD